MKEVDKSLSVGREGMLNKIAMIFFINKAGYVKPPRMLGDSLSVGPDSIDNTIQKNAGVLFNQQKNLDAIVIGDTLKMPFHLFWSFKLLSHIVTLRNYS